MVDIRTEHLHINKHVRYRVDEAGEHIVWFEYVKQGEVDGTVFDDLYDQGSPLYPYPDHLRRGDGRCSNSSSRGPSTYSEPESSNAVRRR